MSKSTKTKEKKLSATQVAKLAMLSYIDASAKKAKYSNLQAKAKEVLEAFANANRGKFNEDGNYKLPGGYLHFGEESVIVPCEGFDFLKFAEAFPQLIDKKFKTAPIKSMLTDEEGVKKLTGQHCVELKKEEKFSIVLK
jgi:hypothetical protein